MADIFISYASPDRQSAERLAAAFEALGWSVWWDRSIRSGTAFDRVIEEAIGDARTVVVIWSANSVKSDWVRAEAAYALSANKLAPISIDKSLPPLRYVHIQTLDLSAWDGSPGSAMFDRLVRDLRFYIEGDRVAPAATQRAKEAADRQARAATEQRAKDEAERLAREARERDAEALEALPTGQEAGIAPAAPAVRGVSPADAASAGSQLGSRWVKVAASAVAVAVLAAAGFWGLSANRAGTGASTGPVVASRPAAAPEPVAVDPEREWLARLDADRGASEAAERRVRQEEARAAELESERRASGAAAASRATREADQPTKPAVAPRVADDVPRVAQDPERSPQLAALPPARTPMPAPSITPVSPSGYTALRVAKVHAEPDAAAKQLGVLAANAQVVVTGKVADRDWLRVTYRDQVGYVEQASLNPSPAPKAPRPETPSARKSTGGLLPARCQDITERVQLGEPLTNADRAFLASSCNRRE